MGHVILTSKDTLPPKRVPVKQILLAKYLAKKENAASFSLIWVTTLLAAAITRHRRPSCHASNDAFRIWPSQRVNEFEKFESKYTKVLFAWVYISQIFHIFPFSEFIRTYFPVKSLFPSLHSLSKKSSAKYPVHSTRVYVSVLILKSWSWFAFRPFIYSPPSLGMCLQNLQNDGHLSKWREKNYNRVQRVRSGTGRGRFAGKASNLFTTLMQ